MSYVSEFAVDLSANGDGVVATGSTIPPTSFYTRIGKRALDVLLVLLVAPIILPVVLLCALAIRMDGGPAFFVQKRLGQGGRAFPILKLRTMVVDAEARLREHISANPDARAEWEINQKLKTDPRITAVGRFLRRTSLDELPQFWNVLRGDMSLIGPRPMTVSQGPLYPDYAYYLVRPGVSGPWQVTDRHETTFAERAIYDNAYVRGLSFWGDVRILSKTIMVVLRCTGL